MSSFPQSITASPAADQHIVHEEKEYTTVKEGLAYILIPASAAKTPQTAPKGDNQSQSVFYNPIQQFNRDLSVLAIKAYGEEVLEKRQKTYENKKKRFAVNKDKKRKRENDGVGNEARKAGKLGEGDREDELHTTANAEVLETPEIVQSTILEQQGGSSVTDRNGNTKVLAEKESSSKKQPAQEDISMADSAEQEVETKTTVNEESKPDISSESKKENKPHFRILDALSATGLRALRYAHEIPFTTLVTANDLLQTATEAIQLNVQHNKLEDKISANTGNALTHMYKFVGDDTKDTKGNPRPSEKYDVIDLDPYGTAAPFLDAAVQAVRDDGGLLCVTCTDAGVWASNGYPEKSFSLYGGTPMKGVMSHEAGLRLILHAIATSAARYGLAIEPLLSLSIDFYARVFVRITKSANDVKFLAGKTMVINNCDTGCGAWTTQTLGKNKLTKDKNGKGFYWKHVFGPASLGGDNCLHCGMKTHLAGPMYAGPIHSPEFIKRILDGLPNVSKDTYQTTVRIEGMLNLALEEVFPLEDDPDSPTATSKTRKCDHSIIDLAPFFFIPSALSKVIHCVTPHEDAVRGALRHLGYWCTRSHAKPGSIKTNAPWDVIWEIMREWTRQKQPIKKGAIRENTAGYHIMGMGIEKNLASNGAVVTSSEEKAADDKTPSDTPIEKKFEKKFEVVFDEKLGKERDTRKLVRYQLNPRENWGPMNRAKGKA
ncbi:N2,N2-dimethylguanosine tRNA methyltransferase [Stipitochalara longipes BDJ]|nr:N2,N2-dimethylguanosine tRNA methyltransferase [Stipitochalara longipes BDJ]